MKNLITFVLAVVAFLVTSFSSNASELIVSELTPEEWVTFQSLHNNGPEDIAGMWFGMSHEAKGGYLSLSRGHIYDSELGGDNVLTFRPGEANPRIFFTGESPNLEIAYTGLGTTMSFPGLPDGGVKPNLLIIDLRSVPDLNLTAQVAGITMDPGVYIIRNDDWSRIDDVQLHMSSASDYQGEITSAGFHLGVYNIQGVPEPGTGSLALIAIIAMSRMFKRRQQ